MALVAMEFADGGPGLHSRQSFHSLQCTQHNLSGRSCSAVHYCSQPATSRVQDLSYPFKEGDARDLNRQSGVCLLCAARSIGPQTRGSRDGRCGFVGATAAIVARQTRARRRRRGPLGQHGAPRRERSGSVNTAAAAAGRWEPSRGNGIWY